MTFPEFVSLYDKLLGQKQMEQNNKDGKTLSMSDIISKMNTGREE